MSRWRWALVVVLVGSLVGVTAWALGRGAPEDAEASDPPVTASPSPTEDTATPSPSPEPSPTEEVLPANDVQDPLEAIVAIEAYRDWLFEHPDPDKVDLIYHEACECYDLLRQQLQGLLDDEVQVVGVAATEVRNIELLERDSPRTVIATYSTQLPEQELRSNTGDVLETSPAQDEPQDFRINLFWDDSGRWVVIGLVEVTG